MAITWNQIADPNFTQSNALMTRGQDLWSQAAKGLGQTFQDFAQAKETQNTNKLMDMMYQAKDPAAFQNQEFQNNLASMRESMGPNYDAEKYRVAMDNRLGKLQTDAVNAMAFQEKEDAQYNQPLLRQYYQDIQNGNYASADGVLKQMRGNSAQYIPQGLNIRKDMHGMSIADQQLAISKDNQNLAWQKFGFEQDESDRNYNLKVGELNAPTGQYSIDPKTGDVVYEQTGGGGYAAAGGGGVMPSSVRQGIFRGESGGDYDALLNFSNRKGGQFSNVRLTNMTVDQAIQFSSAGGAYANYSKSKVGKVATPMGAYQIVGSTLQEAKKAMGLKGNERMTPQMQDALGDYIYQTQGTGAWVGYKGRAGGGGGYKRGASAPAATTQTAAQQKLDSSGLAFRADQKNYYDTNIAAMNAKMDRWKKLQADLPLNRDSSKEFRSIGYLKTAVPRSVDILKGLSDAGINTKSMTERQVINTAVQFNNWIMDNKGKDLGILYGDKGVTANLTGSQVIAAARAYGKSVVKANNTYTNALNEYNRRSSKLTNNYELVKELNDLNKRK